MELTAVSRRLAIEVVVIFTNKRLHPQRNLPLGGKQEPWQVNVVDTLPGTSLHYLSVWFPISPCLVCCTRHQSSEDRQELPDPLQLQLVFSLVGPQGSHSEPSTPSPATNLGLGSSPFGKWQLCASPKPSGMTKASSQGVLTHCMLKSKGRKTHAHVAILTPVPGAWPAQSHGPRGAVVPEASRQQAPALHHCHVAASFCGVFSPSPTPANPAQAGGCAVLPLVLSQLSRRAVPRPRGGGGGRRGRRVRLGQHRLTPSAFTQSLLSQRVFSTQ